MQSNVSALAIMLTPCTPFLSLQESFTWILARAFWDSWEGAPLITVIAFKFHILHTEKDPPCMSSIRLCHCTNLSKGGHSSQNRENRSLSNIIHITTVGKSIVIHVRAANPKFFPMAHSDFLLYSKINGAPDRGRKLSEQLRRKQCPVFQKMHLKRRWFCFQDLIYNWMQQ